MKYRIYDNYDLQNERLGESNTINGLRKFVRERFKDTDGECFFILRALNEHRKYSIKAVSEEERKKFDELIDDEQCKYYY